MTVKGKRQSIPLTEGPASGAVGTSAWGRVQERRSAQADYWDREYVDRDRHVHLHLRQIAEVLKEDREAG